jgi:hypothetical protein
VNIDILKMYRVVAGHSTIQTSPTANINADERLETDVVGG